MKASTIIAIVVCALLPVLSYLFMRNYTNKNVKFPRRYFYDYIKEDTIDGKKKTDTMWHRVKNLQLINQFGDTVTLDSLHGKVLMVNFFFTHCPTICPGITKNLKKVQTTIAKDSGLHLISITLDPKRDSVKTLRKYAASYGVKNDNWWFCRLVKDTLENVMMKEFKAGFQRDSIIEITHTPDVFLLDKNRIIRGKTDDFVVTPEDQELSRFYNGTIEKDMIQMVKDATLLKMERVEKSKPPFALLIGSLLICGVVFIGVLYFNKKKKSFLNT